MEPVVRVGVGVFIWKDGFFLMGQRRGAHGAGTWSVPGGHLEFNESWEQCAKREVMEETGLYIKNVHFLAATNDIFKTENKHYITVWVQSDWQAGKPTITEPDKFITQKWCSLKELPTPLFLPWNQLREMVPELFKL